MLDLIYVTHDRASGILTATASVKNTSNDVLRGTVVIRAVSLRSPIGMVSIANAENGITGPGAIWDFTGTLPGGRLLPDSVGIETPLVFRLSDVRPANPARDVFEFGVVEMDVSVLGGSPHN